MQTELVTTKSMPTRSRTLRIGELSRMCGLSPDTLRHYERLGLLAPAARTSGGFRQYPQGTVRRITIIQRSLAIGFTLAELRTIFGERAAGRAPCQKVRVLAGEKLRSLEERTRELERLAKVLRGALDDWDARLRSVATGRPAHLLESLTDLPETAGPAATHQRPPRGGRGRDRL